MNDEKKEDEPESSSIAWMGFVIAVSIILVVGFALYQTISEPYRTADKLRDVVNNQMNNISDDYREGWLDCVDYYLKMKTEMTNMTQT